MSNKEELVIKSLEKLYLARQETIKRIEDLIKEKNKYVEDTTKSLEGLSLSEDNPELEKNPDYKSNKKALEETKHHLKRAKTLYSGSVENYGYIKTAINFGVLTRDISLFSNAVDSIQLMDISNVYDFVCLASSIVRIKYPYLSKDIHEVNKSISTAQRLNSVAKITGYGSLTNQAMDKTTEIKFVLGSVKSFYDTTISFMEKVIEGLEGRIERLKAKKKEILEKDKTKKSKVLLDKAKEYDLKIDKEKERLASLDEIDRLILEYNDTKDETTLDKIINKLKFEKILSNREVRLTTYKKEDPIPTPVEKPEEPVVVELPKEEPPKLDNDYFRRSNSKCIICFAGKEDNPILKDIADYLNDPERCYYALQRITQLFEELVTGVENNTDLGSNPHEGTDSKCKRLKSTLGFEYKKYGKERLKYRIHAIKRYSSLLKEMGFGSGDIIFFGAVGPNEDNSKYDTYARMGERCIEKISDTGNQLKLQPNFDYIEHITRRYIPITLLSERDRVKLINGAFSGKTKKTEGGMEKSIESLKYVLFDLLDQDTKANVKKYLEDYFIEQTVKMADIQKKYKTIKGNSLD